MVLNIFKRTAAPFNGNMINDFFLSDIFTIANNAHIIHPPLADIENCSTEVVSCVNNFLSIPSLSANLDVVYQLFPPIA